MLRAILAVLLLVKIGSSSALEADVRLLVNAPSYWGTSKTIGQGTLPQGTTFLHRIPEDQSETNYDESIWEYRFPMDATSTGSPPTIDVLGNHVLTHYWRLCESVRSTPLTKRTESGFSVAYVQATCNRLKNDLRRGILIRAKIVLGKTHFFLVAHEFILRGFEAVRGGEAGVIPTGAFSDIAHSDRAMRYLKDSSENLRNNVKICLGGENC